MMEVWYVSTFWICSVLILYVYLANQNNLQICRLREGVGTATNNVAEYRAMILGLKYALDKGYTSIQVQGDSKLVCMQVCFVLRSCFYHLELQFGLAV